MNILADIQNSLQHLLGENYASKKYLLAVSGGVDSMVLLNTFKQLNLQFEVAHCNYQLRGVDSDEDAKLIEKTCAEYGVVCHVKSFETEEYIQKNGGSTQEVARKLRYDWFNKLMLNHDNLVTAHHLNDNIETFFINLSRGSGLKGLSGIPQKNDKIIRPMLKISKKEILTYAQENNIAWREDESNKTDKYIRNKYRNQILPSIREIKPQFDSVMNANIERLNNTKLILNFFIDEIKKEAVKEERNQIVIELDKLQNYPSKEIILFELIQTYGFNYEQVKEMLSVTESGKLFLTKDHKAVVYRNELQIFSKEKAIVNEQICHSVEELKMLDYFSSVEVLENLEKLDGNKKIAYLDLDAVHFPLAISNIKEGDVFMPLGMKNKKKVVDFLSNENVSILEKEHVLVLKNQSNILWVIDYRLDERCKVRTKTKRILKLVTK